MRIMLQNLLLQGVTLVFALLALAAALRPDVSSLVGLIFQGVMLAAALQWCHHGVRTAQIKAFLLESDPDAQQGGWETWLPQNRPDSLLGSRWLVSTKGVFLGLGAMMLFLDTAFLAPVRPWPFLAALVLWAIAAVALFTNPKE